MMKSIFIILFVALPLIMAATLPENRMTEEEIEKRMSIGFIISLLKSLDLSDGCIKVCEEHVTGYWSYLCKSACKVILA